MSPITIGSKPRQFRLLRLSILARLSLATLALFMSALPSYAADPQPQSPPSQPSQPAAPQMPQPFQPAQSPDATCPPGGQCFADVPSTNPFYTFINRIYQQDLVTGYPCGGTGEPCDAQNRPYYRPGNNVTRQQMAKFIDNARRLPQIRIETTMPNAAIWVSNVGGDGIYATTSGSNSAALYGWASANGEGVVGRTSGGFGVVGTSTSGHGVVGTSSTGDGVVGTSTSSEGVAGVSTSGAGVFGTGNSYAGVFGMSSTGAGVRGVSTTGAGVLGGSGTGPGMQGTSTGGDGVYGVSTSNVGVEGSSDSGSGVYGHSNSQIGVRGISSSNFGVYGYSTSNWAGYFWGDVNVTGNCCSAGAGSFKIDDPLDPANKYLYHSAVQSPDMMDIYNGNITLDDKGEAWVQMPEWFQALNRDFRYQLTAVGGPGPDLYIAQKMSGNRFKIAGGSPGLEVSWQVTGIRQDGYANAHRTPVEQAKPAGEQGKYLHPTELGQPASLGVDYEQQQKMQQTTQTKP